MKGCRRLLLLACVAFGGWTKAEAVTCTPYYKTTQATDNLPPGLSPIIGVEQAPPTKTLIEVQVKTGGMDVTYTLLPNNTKILPNNTVDVEWDDNGTTDSSSGAPRSRLSIRMGRRRPLR